MNPAYATLFAPLAMGLILPLGLFFDAVLPRHRAVLATLLVGFLFLPHIEYDLAGVLLWNRTTAPALTILLGVALRDWGRIADLRLRWWDLPMAAWCLAPLPSSVVNGLGLYDGLSGVFYQALQWGVPYLIGRLHFRDRHKLVDLAWCLVLGALIYLPLCLWEIRMAPTLHKQLYGFHQHYFVQTIRGSLYRPMVFMQHGLMAAMWMGMGTLTAGILAWSGGSARILGIPLKLFVPFMTAVFVLMQSWGAVALFFGAAGLIVFCRTTRWRWPLFLLAMMPALWCTARVSGALPSRQLVSVVAQLDESRASSFESRLRQEEVLADRVLQSPLFGWGTWGRDRTVGQAGDRESITVDGLWILAYSRYGLFGLLSLLLLHLCPVWIAFRRAPPEDWRTDPYAFLAAGLGVVLGTVMLDNLLNAMINPLFILIAGALPTALAVHARDRVAAEITPRRQRFARVMGE